MTFVGYRYRLYPDTDQEKILIGWIGQARFIFNKCLELQQNHYDETKHYRSVYDIKKLLPDFKEQYPWLQAPAHVFQNKVYDLDNAIIRSFTIEGCGKPKFKKKYYDKSGIRIDQVNNKHIKLQKNQIKIPKLGWIQWVYHRKINGRMIAITIKRDIDQWYITVLTDNGQIIETPTAFNDNECVGIDLGLEDFAILDDNQIIRTPKFYRKKLKKLKSVQRKQTHKRLAREKLLKTKTLSQNQIKYNKVVAKVHRKIRNQRADFHHQHSNSITKKYRVVFFEDLAIKAMIQDRKYAKSIADQGWGQFVNFVSYKSHWRLGLTHKIDRWIPSTKECSVCHNKRKITINERIYICARCGNIQPRDLNAAVNIKYHGIIELNRAGTVRIYACGDTQVLLKQESSLVGEAVGL
jgi:putative transposase